MRAVAFSIAVALLLPGCLARPAQRERSGEVGYNRRELPPARGVFSGDDGVFRIYSNERDPAEPQRPPLPPRKTTLSCERGQTCDPPPAP